MDYKILKTILFALIILSCNRQEHNSKSNITIYVKVIDSETKQPRVNDTLTVRQAEWGIPRKYKMIGQYITDSLGIVSLKIDRNERYSFETDGPNYAFGSDEYGKDELKNNQKIIIKVIPPNKKQFKIE